MRGTFRTVITAVALGAAAVPGSAAAQEPAPAPAPAPGAVEQVSHLGRTSYYAFVNRAVPARKRPKASAKRVAKLRLHTPEGTAEVVFVLDRTTDAAGRVWYRVRLPIRPNGRTGWVPEAALGSLQPVTTWLKVDTKKLRATLIRSGKPVFRARIGAGQPRWPTPKGNFYVRFKLAGYDRLAGAMYGPVAFGTSATSNQLTDWPGGGVVGIHGTNQPGLIPGRPSHGCVRLRNPDILRLARLMGVGTPITIT